MFRLLSHVFGWNYEPCKGCEVLRTQIQISNDEKKELINTLLNLVKPQIFEQPTKEIRNLQSSPAAMTFSRRRAELEKNERTRDQIVKTSPFLAKPDDMNLTKPVEVLEKELEELEAKNA